MLQENNCLILTSLSLARTMRFLPWRPLRLYWVNFGAVNNVQWEIGDAVDARMVAKVTQRFGHVRIYFH